MLISSGSWAAQGPDSQEPFSTLLRVGAYVQRYFDRAQSIVATEEVILQPLGADLTLSGLPRKLVYEIRLEWDHSRADGLPAAMVIRDLLRRGSRAPRPDEEPGCLDPRGISPEPLGMLLPSQHDRYVFTHAGTGRIDGRPALLLDYLPVEREPPQVVWREECVSIDLPGRTRGRVWVDAESAEVLRFDERVTGLVDVPVPTAQQRRGAAASMTIERADMSVRYRPVTFQNPDETLMLPYSVDLLTVIRNSGVPRLRTTHRFSNYRRFVTDSRVLPARAKP